MELTPEIIGASVAAVGTAFGGWKWLDGKLSRKADQASVEAAFKEIDKRRDIEAKLFDLLRAHEQQDRDRFDAQEKSNRDRHDELMTVVGDIRADIAGLK